MRSIYGNDWQAIGAAMGRSASSIKDRCRLMKDNCNQGNIFTHYPCLCISCIISILIDISKSHVSIRFVMFIELIQNIFHGSVLTGCKIGKVERQIVFIRRFTDHAKQQSNSGVVFFLIIFYGSFEQFVFLSPLRPCLCWVVAGDERIHP